MAVLLGFPLLWSRTGSCHLDTARMDVTQLDLDFVLPNTGPIARAAFVGEDVTDSTSAAVRD